LARAASAELFVAEGRQRCFMRSRAHLDGVGNGFAAWALFRKKEFHEGGEEWIGRGS